MISRYSRPEMSIIWSEESKFQIWLEIEAHACDAQAKLGAIPKSAATTIWKKGAFDTVLLRFAGGLLAAGILGNLTDRVLQGFFLPAYREEGFFTRLSHGYVVDFLDFKIGLYGKLFPATGGHWPSFNVADSCICVAAFFLILSTFRSEAQSKGSKEGSGAEA